MAAAIFQPYQGERQSSDMEWRYVRTDVVGYRLQYGKPAASYRFIGLRHATMGITELCSEYSCQRPARA